MSEIIGETVVKRLIAWGVDRVFEAGGAGLSGVLEGLRRHPDEIRVVAVEDESAAAELARAHARQSGGLGVCLTSSGPGGIHLRNGLYDAMVERTPVLAIIGVPQQRGREVPAERACQPEENLDRLFVNTFPGCSCVITTTAQVPAAVDLMVGRALSERTVSHLAIPDDIQAAEVPEEPSRSPHWVFPAAGARY
jgi:pyruvate dehydrogenase (quinone)